MTISVPHLPAGADGAAGVELFEPSLEDLYEHAPCGYLTTAPNGVVVKVNETFLAWTGYSRDQVVGQPFASLLNVGSQLFYATRCLPVLRLEGEVREVALVLDRSHGRPLPILVNSIMLAGDDGQPRLVRTAVFDATRRQDYERDLLFARRAAERSEVRIRTLQEAAATFGAAKSEESVTAALAEIACAAFDATCATVMLPVTDSGNLRAVAGAAHPVGESVSIDSQRPEAEALRRANVVTISSVDEAERMFPALAEPLHAARLEAMTATPLLADDAPMGVLVCFFGRRRDFEEDELALNRTLARLGAQALQRIRLQEQLEHLALHDKLTGLANRELLQDRLAQALFAASRHLRPMSVIFLDLDGFKAINDQLGHAAGDAVLVEVSARLRGAVRPSDTIARFGGDEFVVVCEDAAADAAVAVAERIRMAIGQPIAHIPVALPLTASIGVARHRPNGGRTPEPDEVVRRADAAMYQSKESGKDRYTVVDI